MSQRSDQGVTPSGSGCQPSASAASASSRSGIPNATKFHKGQLVRDIRNDKLGYVEQPLNGFGNVTIRLADGWLRSIAPEHLESAQ